MGLSHCKASLFRISSTAGLRPLLVRLSSAYGSVASEALLSRAGSVATDRNRLRPLIGSMTPACSSMTNGGCECGIGGDLLRSLTFFGGGGGGGGAVAVDDDNASCTCTC